MVLAGAGGVDHDALVKLANQYFPAKPTNDSIDVSNITDSRYTGRNHIAFVL